MHTRCKISLDLNVSCAQSLRERIAFTAPTACVRKPIASVARILDVARVNHSKKHLACVSHPRRRRARCVVYAARPIERHHRGVTAISKCSPLRGSCARCARARPSSARRTSIIRDENLAYRSRAPSRKHVRLVRGVQVVSCGQTWRRRRRRDAVLVRARVTRR